MKDFDVRDVKQTLNSVSLDADVGGFGPDDFIKVMPDGPLFEDKQGCDGEATRYRIHNGMCTIEVHIMSTSDMNDRLSALLSADLIAKNGAGAGPYLCRNPFGRNIVASERAWVIGWPDDIGQGKEPGVNVWKIRLADTKIFIGGM